MATHEDLRAHLALAMGGAAVAFTVFGLLRAHGNSPAMAAEPAGPPGAALGLSGAFTQAGKSVSPSVVSITSVLGDDLAEMTSPMQPPQDPNELFRRFFEDFGTQAPQGPFGFKHNAAPFGPREGQGTGIVVRQDGYNVTNNHVVAGAEEVRVRLDGGREYEAQVVGADSESDLAVLKIDAGGLDPVELGDSDHLEVGEWVIAVGSPFGLERTVTAGIVSATGRSGMGLATYEDFIQTDAAINPGNSGGPLVDLHGLVVGVNTAISTRTGGFMGVGFAIPAGTVRHVVDDIIDSGRVTRGWLGVQIQPLSEDLAKSFGLESTDGVLVADVMAGGPAAEAGLQAGDVVTQVGHRHVSTPAEMMREIAEADPGARVQISVMRGGSESWFPVTLGERPAPDSPAGAAEATTPSMDLGMKLAPQEGGGAIIETVQPGGAADRAGLREGDVILRIADREVSDPTQFWAAASDVELGPDLRLLVQRGEHKLFLILKTGQA